jgi:hypothetical protein
MAKCKKAAGGMVARPPVPAKLAPKRMFTKRPIAQAPAPAGVPMFKKGGKAKC